MLTEYMIYDDGQVLAELLVREITRAWRTPRGAFTYEIQYRTDRIYVLRVDRKIAGSASLETVRKDKLVSFPRGDAEWRPDTEVEGIWELIPTIRSSWVLEKVFRLLHDPASR